MCSFVIHFNMFRTKKDVDRHVHEIFRKLKGENERIKRYYNFAKLYYQVNEYESARRYVSGYLSVHDNSAEGHKLLGHCLEALGQKEKALQQYKCSLMLDNQQADMVLKVCEILAEVDNSGDKSNCRYWCERAEQLYPHHPAVFRLKEQMLTSEGEDNTTDLEALIASELTVRPRDVGLRVRLLKLFLTTSRLTDAYNHALEVEMRAVFRDELKWYDCLAEVFKAYLEANKDACGWEFYLHYTSVLERAACLNLQEQQSSPRRSIADCVQALFSFDQVLDEASMQCPPGSEQSLYQEFLRHQRGQLCLHMATVLLKRAKKEQSNWRDTCRMVAPLLLHALTQPPDLHAEWLSHATKLRKKSAEWWVKEASYRNSQSGHVILGLLHERRSQFLDRVTQFCSSTWRERVFQKIFNTRDHRQAMATSHFLKQSGFADPPLQLPTANELRPHDEMSQKLYPGSLHHLIWLGLQEFTVSKKNGGTAKLGPDFRCLVFDTLQLTCNNLNMAGSETLNRLDVDAFLYAAVLCARATLEEQQAAGFLSNERPPTLPTNITEQLCTVAQARWWTAAYRVFMNQAKGDLGELRQVLQRGIEVVRVLGNHGLDVRLIVQLARTFSERASAMLARTETSADLVAVEARAALYWTSALPLLDKLQRTQAIRAPHTRLFEYQGKELSAAEVNALIEEGRFFLACQLMKEDKHEKALEAFQQLKSPYASFYQSVIYKKLAAEELEEQRRELITSEMRSRHIVLLTKARECLYLTLDRLRSPGVDRRHPLNAELSTHIEEIESQLDRIDPDMWRNDVNRNESEGISDGSVSSAGENVNSLAGLNSSSMYLHLTPRHMNSQKLGGTPYRSSHRIGVESVDTPGQEHTRRTEARPSPERLEAQIRNMMHGRDSLMQTVVQQNKALLESNKGVAASLNKVAQGLDDLKILIQEMMKKETAKRGDMQLNSDLPQVCDPEEDLYVFDDDYSEEVNLTAAHLSQYHHQAFPPYPSYPAYPRQMSGMLGTSTVTYGPPPPSEVTSAVPPPPLLPPGPAAIGGFFRNMDPAGLLYQQTLGYYGQGALPFSEGQQLPDFRGPAAAPAFSRLVNAPPVIPTASVAEPVAPPVLQPAKLVQPVGPVNVVITSSDTLPTSAPLTQPTLSVTIPPQHRLGAPLVHATGAVPVPAGVVPPSTPVAQPPTIMSIHSTPGGLPAFSMLQAATAVQSQMPTTSTANVPHAFQISMPPQAQLPHASLLEKGAAALSPVLPISTHTLLQSVPSPMYSAVAPDRSPAGKEGPTPPKPHRVSTGLGVDEEDEDTEHDPCPDFQPVIPLPAEVEMTTGEEEESVLFESRAKLFRFVEKEWKERGIGLLKLLHNRTTGKVRVLMRREQVLKVCANHYLSTDMVLTPMKDRAWMWVANDFADEKVRLEKLCARFKTPDEAANFRDAFEQAREIVKNISSIKSSDISTVTTPTVSSQFINSPVTSAPSSNTEKIVVGGFTFMAQPTFKVDQKSLDQSIASKDEKEDKDNGSNASPRQSPFLNMFFFNTPVKSTTEPVKSTTEPTKSTTEPTKSTTEPTSAVTTSDEPPPLRRPHLSVLNPPSVPSSSIEPGKLVVSEKGNDSSMAADKLMFTSPITATFSTLASAAKEPVFKKDDNFKGFEGAGKPLFGSSSARTTPTTKNVESSAASRGDDTTDEFVPTAEFKPVIPLPELIQVKTGEEGEEVLFQERAKILRFDSEGKQWKERGIGNMKILKDPTTGRVRLLMRREQVFKVCCNHVISSTMQFKAMQTSDRAWSWFAQDYSEGEVKPELLAIKFKTVEQAQSFKKAIDEVQSKIGCETVSTVLDSSEVQEKTRTDVWKCICLFPNAADAKECRSCNRPKPRVAKDGTSSFGKEQQPKLSELFKPPAGSWKCSTCYVQNEIDTQRCVACSSLNPKTMVPEPKSSQTDKPPLSEMFKPKSGSWECKACYTFNDEHQNRCLSCETDKVKPVSATPGKQNGISLMDSFRPKAGTWECKACFVRNAGSDIECMACTTPKPGHEAAAKDKVKAASTVLQFGIPPSGISSGTETQPQEFTFGIPAATTEPGSFKFEIQPSSAAADSTSPSNSSLFAPPTTKTEFTFGTSSVPVSQCQTLSSSMKSDQAKPFMFEPMVGAKTFRFGNTDSAVAEGTVDAFAFGVNDCPAREGTPPKDGAPRNFIFGSPGKFDFNFSGLRPKSPIKSPKSPGVVASGGEEDSGSEPEEDEGEHIFFHPLIPLPEKVPLHTGEEEEDTLYCHRAKLFRFMGGEWKERGVGDFKVLKHRTTHKVRLLMRRDQVLKLCLNHFLTPDLSFQEKDEKSWLWNAPDFSEGEIRQESFALRFKNKEIAIGFKQAIDQAQSEVGLPHHTDQMNTKENVSSERTSKYMSPGSSNTGFAVSSVMKNFTFSLPDNSSPATPSLASRSPLSGTPGGIPEPKGVARSLFGSPQTPNIALLDLTDEDEVKVVYEATVTAEERAQAERLKLPSNFYAYRRRPPCPGCRGCELDNDPEEERLSITHEDVSNKTQDQSISLRTSLLFPTSKMGTSIFTATKQPSVTKSTFDNQLTSTGDTSEPKSTVSLGSVTKPTAIVFSQSATETLASKSTVASVSQSCSNIQQPIVTSIFGQPSESTAISQPTASSFFNTTASSFSVSRSPASIFTQVTSTNQSTTTPLTFGHVTSTEGSVKPIFGQLTSSFPVQKSSVFGQQTFGSSLSDTTIGTPIFGQQSSVGTSGMASATPVFGLQPPTPAKTTDAAIPVTTAANSASLFSSKPSGFSSETAPSNVPFSFEYSGTKGGSGNDQLASKPVGFGFPSKSVPDSFTFSLTSGMKAGAPDPCEESQEEEQALPFLSSDSNLSFASLAVKTQPSSFNSGSTARFTWENAGATVFGKAPLAQSNLPTAISSPDKGAADDKDKDGGGSSDEGGGAGDENVHDPHFEPIIALPDAIEVRTGEEDEIKVFCHRAKLYRFESSTHEWKERGIGEMKILHDPTKGTYRLLLRREQVHKVVCNQLVTPNLRLSALQSSDRTWCWAGLNHAEEEARAEKLAVRFKFEETALEFQSKLEQCVEEVTRRTALNISTTTCESHDSTTGTELLDRVSSESEGFEDEDDEEDDEDESERSVMFEKRATLLVQNPGYQEWSALGQGDLQVVYDPDYFAARIVVMADITKRMLCNTIIAINSDLEVRKKECEWSGLNFSEENPVVRTFLARFSSETAALEFQQVFSDGKQMAVQSGVVDHLDPEEVLED